MRNLAKLALVALVAVMCVNASAVTSASAGEPLFITESKKALLFTSTSGAVTLRAKQAGLEAAVECEKSSGHGFVLDKSSLARELHVEYSGKCAQKINGGVAESCSEPIKPVVSYGELGLLNRHVPLLVAPEKGTEFVEVTCGAHKTKFTGALIGEFSLKGEDGLSQYQTLREEFLLLYNAKGTTRQELEEIELLGSLMKGVTLLAEGFLGEKASEETAQEVSFDGAVAITIEAPRGILLIKQAGTLDVPENSTNTYTVEYLEGTDSSRLKQWAGPRPISSPTGTCEGAKLTNIMKTCNIGVSCANGSRRARGFAMVLAEFGSGVVDTFKRVVCT